MLACENAIVARMNAPENVTLSGIFTVYEKF